MVELIAQSTQDAETWFADNWPVILIALAVVIIVLSILRKLAKLAFIGAGIAVIGLVLLPYVRG